MTISHRRRRGSSSTSSATTSATLGQEMVASPEMSAGTNDDEWLPPPKFLRGSAELPPPIANESERPLLRPDGET